MCENYIYTLHTYNLKFYCFTVQFYRSDFLKITIQRSHDGHMIDEYLQSLHQLY